MTEQHTRIEFFELDELKTAKKNPKKHDLDAIAASIRRFGFKGALLRNEKTGRLVAGHGRLETLQRMRDAEEPLPAGLQDGWKVPVLCGLSFKNQREAEAYLVADNRLVELGGWEKDMLADILQSTAQHTEAALEGVGYTQRDIDLMLRGSKKGDPGNDLPDAPDARCQLGDVWHLGDHVLVCGTCTDASVVAKAMGGDTADMVITDPPYGVNYENASGKVHNDAPEQLEGILDAAFDQCFNVSRDGAVWYVFAPHGPNFMTFARKLEALQVWRQTLVWVKSSLVLGHSDFHYRHEAIFYGWKPGAHEPIADRKQDTVWEFDKPKRNANHPTPKPVEMVAKAIELSSLPGNVVFDPFSGSGTTLMACEQLGRKARCTEIFPGYCDVILARWEEYTGKEAVLAHSGAL